MSRLTRQYDTTNELEFYSYNCGIKIIRPDVKSNKKNDDVLIKENRKILDLMSLPCNVYFLNTDSYYVNANELCAENCFKSSPKAVIGKSVRTICTREEAEGILLNDSNVITTRNLIISDEQMKRKEDGAILRGLSIKLPWYGIENKIIGLVGFTVMSSAQMLAEVLLSITKMGLLSSPLNNKISVLKYQINGVELSTRETDVMRLMLRGKTAKESAKFLGLSYRTVEFHIENIKMKTNIASRSELIDKVVSFNNLNLI